MTGPNAATLAALLRAAGCVYAEQEAGLILQAGADPWALARRRAAGEPLEVVLGWAEFGGLRLSLGPGVFVPRRRTQALAWEVARIAPQGGWVADLCCGVGSIAAVVAHRRPDVHIAASDIDPVATMWARRNLPPRAQVATGDLFCALAEELAGRLDVVVANAPYVPAAHVRLMPPEARDHEPLHTLAGGGDGLEIQRRIAAQAGRWLAPRGVLLLETSRGQAPATARLLRGAGMRTRVRHAASLAATWVEGRPASGFAFPAGGAQL